MPASFLRSTNARRGRDGSWGRLHPIVKVCITSSVAATRDIVVIGASAGGVEALISLARELPADLPASTFVVQHVAAEYRSVLPQLLSHAGELPAHHPSDGETFYRGNIYIAPPNHHMTLDHASIRVAKRPRDSRHRPSIDLLFRTAALAHGPRVIAVVLTGALDDGSAGLVSVKERGGFAVVQDPREAYCPDMPRAALARVVADAVVTIRQLSGFLAEWTRAPLSVGHAPGARRALVRSNS
jgi:two-component system, chemotaxis family, protein-glutamate methylesterase/glutaminase